MSDTEELVRMMRHVATLCDTAMNRIMKPDVIYRSHTEEVQQAIVKAAAALSAANHTLQLVAGMTEPEGARRLRDAVEDLKFGYDAWAEDNAAPTMLDNELQAVVAFIRYRMALDRKRTPIQREPADIAARVPQAGY